MDNAEYAISRFRPLSTPKKWVLLAYVGDYVQRQTRCVQVYPLSMPKSGFLLAYMGTSVQRRCTPENGVLKTLELAQIIELRYTSYVAIMWLYSIICYINSIL